MRAVSLFSGVEGLGLAVAEVFGAHPVAFAEFEANPSKVLAAHYPGVPNVGDVTTADWSDYGDVDVIHGGPPCQPFSAAGRREGMVDDRWMWPAMERAVRVVRPRYVVVENVPPLVASDAWGVIVSDLAALGYVGSWLCLRASDVGACHQRLRVFLLATHASGAGAWWDGRGAFGAQEPAGWRQPNEANAPVAGVAAPPHPDSTGPQGRRAVRGGGGERPAGPGGVAAVADPDDGGLERAGRARDGRDGPADDGGPAAADPDGAGSEAWGDDAVRGGWEPTTGRRQLVGGGGSEDGGVVDWGDYAPAIARHELAIGRPAPAPVDERGRLSARFVEWMQMFPEGWVTDVLPRNPALKALGNAVVPTQGAMALRLLLARVESGVLA